MRDAAQRAIGPHDLWQGTLMANSARDPLWRAFVSAEIAATPSRKAEIEAKCLGCHAPMAAQVGLDDHGTGSLLHVLDCDSELGELARDGVSCTICHGMSPRGLGTEASFSGGFRLDDARRIFGPHADPFAMPMRHQTGFTPTLGPHVLQSSLCGTCHTLETEAFAPDGQRLERTLLEQAPYLEWRNSDYRDEGGDRGPLAHSCASCHLPTTGQDGEVLRTRIARNPGGRNFPPTRPRSPYGRHLFVGGNTLVLGMLRDHRDELDVRAPASAIQATLDATRDQLRQRTARIAIETVQLEAGKLAFEVVVENLAGHKLPTGHPTRRAWLQVRVRGEQDELLFASGLTDNAGRIVGSSGQPLPSELAGGPIEPHRDVVRSGEEVALYRAVMADTLGQPTHTLLRGVTWLVDDRLLPKGWNREHPEADRTAPVGTEEDGNFVPGGDRVRFEIALGDRRGPLTIEASLLYQPLGARWAAELLRWPTPEVAAFGTLYERADRTPEVLARARWGD